MPSDFVPAELTSILQKLNLHPHSAIRLVESSFGSKVYRIEGQGEPKVIKLFHGKREYWREWKTLELLEPTGLVPRAIGGLPPSEEFDGALLLEFLEGENLASSPVDKSKAYGTGECLGRLHGHSLGKFGYFGPNGVEAFPFPGWWTFRRQLLGNDWAAIIRRRLDEDFVRRCLDHLAQLSESFSDQEATCLTHCDFRFGNILKRKSGPLAIIDFESAREGDGSYDFVKIWEQLGNPQGSKEWESFLAGYSSVRALPANLDRKLRYYWFDLNYGFLYWAIDRGDEALFQTRLKIVEELLGQKASNRS